MKITNPMVDALILQELGGRIARLRLERNLKQAELAAQAGISKRTLERMEAGGPTELVNLVRVCRALGLAERFDLLLPEPVPSPVEQLRLRGRQRQRAGTPRLTARRPAAKWTWGDEGEQSQDGGGSPGAGNPGQRGKPDKQP